MAIRPSSVLPPPWVPPPSRFDTAPHDVSTGGPEPTAEERAPWWSRWSFQHVRPLLDHVVAGRLVPGLTEAVAMSDKAKSLAGVFYRGFQKERAASHVWDGAVGNEAFIVTRRPGGRRGGRGVLRWVGTLQQARDHRRIRCAVEWRVLPEPYTVALGSPSTDATMSHFDVDVRVVHSGCVDGEQLFDDDEGDDAFHHCHVTLEDIDAVDLIREVGLSTSEPVSVRPKPPSVARTVVAHLTGPVRVATAMAIGHTVLFSSEPLWLRQLILFLHRDGVSADWDASSRWAWGLGLATMFTAVCVAESFLFQAYLLRCRRNILVVRSALLPQVFHKALTISPKAATHPELSAGRVLALVAADVDRISDLMPLVPEMFSAPTQVAISVGLLYWLIGWVAFLTVGLIAISLPLQGEVMKRQYKARSAVSSATDARLRSTSELLASMRVIKYMGWEAPFVHSILQRRIAELSALRLTLRYRVLAAWLVALLPGLMTAAVFLAYYATGNSLTPEVVFPVLALLYSVRFSVFLIPLLFNALITAHVAAQRLDAYLSAEDATSAVQTLYAARPPTSDDPPAPIEADQKSRRPSPPQCAPSATRMPHGAKLEGVTARGYEAVPLPGVLPESPTGLRGALLWVANGVLRVFGSNAMRRRDDRPLMAAEHGAEEAADSPSHQHHRKHQVARYQVLPRTLLRNVSLAFPRGALTVVVGATGAGKTSLLAAIGGQLGIRGHVASEQPVAYAAQQPWIMNASVEENIALFSTTVDADRLHAAIRSCCLDEDVQQMTNGVRTEIGERGVTLSGGQRARVALARAVYVGCPVVLLDDPLAAVDAHVGRRLLRRCICGALAGSTRVLVTHHTGAIAAADSVVVLSNGTVAFSGSQSQYRQWRNPSTVSSDTSSPTSTSSAEDDDSASTDSDEGSAQWKDAKLRCSGGVPTAGTLMTVEERAEGSVSAETYRRYVDACGGRRKVGGIVALFAATELLAAASHVWLAFWASDTFGMDGSTYLSVYVGLALLNAGSGAWRASAVYTAGLRGGEAMHTWLLLPISRAQASFFDTTPVGRILHRFAKDVHNVDNVIPEHVLSLLERCASLASLLLMMTASQPAMFVALVPAFFAFRHLALLSMIAIRETKRVESLNRTPVFTLLQEVLEGSAAIELYRRGQAVITEALRRIDITFSTTWAYLKIVRWMCLRFDLLSDTMIGVAAFGAVACHMWGFGDRALLSLGLTMGIQLAEEVNWVVRQLTLIESTMNAAERILHYADTTPTEPFSLVATAAAGLASSPTSARTKTGDGSKFSLTFRDVKMRYRPELPFVLRGLSFHIEAGQKVGIVGRTGSGKSSTLQVLLRMVELESGSIVIGQSAASASIAPKQDGCRHDEYPLEDLRAKFAVIPQEPVLFTGTMRVNVDPTRSSTDAEVEEALKRVGVWHRAAEDGGLDANVAEGGANLSVGQRQLVCVARALLKRSAGCILMDEATANVDMESDAAVQQLVREAFNDRTVITIAHRLATVLDYDMVLVLDAGVVVEAGPPQDLLTKGGVFQGMVAALEGARGPPPPGRPATAFAGEEAKK